MTSLRFLLRLCEGRIAGEDEPVEPRNGRGILTEPDFSHSRAIVLVDSGGSSM